MTLKKVTKSICMSVVIIFLMYILMTPMGALRMSVALSGNLDSAFYMKVRVASAEDVGLVKLDIPKNSKIYRVETNIPYEEATDSDLENWIVYKFFDFYTARYYGWC